MSSAQIYTLAIRTCTLRVVPSRGESNAPWFRAVPRNGSEQRPKRRQKPSLNSLRERSGPQTPVRPRALFQSSFSR